jgi:hypothetical protein
MGTTIVASHGGRPIRARAAGIDLITAVEAAREMAVTLAVDPFVVAHAAQELALDPLDRQLTAARFLQ